MKVKPGWDVKVLEKIRERWPDDPAELRCQFRLHAADDATHLKSFDRFNLLMIEQPLWSDDFYFHARLQKQLQTALCLDEAIRSARDAEAALELGCLPHHQHQGRACRRLLRGDRGARCGAGFNVPVWCGGMLESGIGRSHNVALSTLPNFKLPGDVSASKRYWKEDIIEPEVVSAREQLQSATSRDVAMNCGRT